MKEREFDEFAEKSDRRIYGLGVTYLPKTPASASGASGKSLSPSTLSFRQALIEAAGDSDSAIAHAAREAARKLF